MSTIRSVDYTKDIAKQKAMYKANNQTLTFDCLNDTIECNDLNAFLSFGEFSSDLGYVRISKKNAEQENNVFKYLDSKSSYIKGNKFVVDLKKYNIDLKWENDEAYIPLQVLSDLINNRYSSPLYYNKKCIAMIGYSVLDIDDYVFLDKLYEVEVGNRTRLLADFTYNCLCMNLDINY